MPNHKDVNIRKRHAFQMLGKRIPKRERTLVLLDEISWMGRHNPDFTGFLKNGWDDYLKVHDNLVLAVCGSVSAWVRKNLLDSATFGVSHATSC